MIWNRIFGRPILMFGRPVSGENRRPNGETIGQYRSGLATAAYASRAGRAPTNARLTNLFIICPVLWPYEELQLMRQVL